jgi:hypothetical protein
MYYKEQKLTFLQFYLAIYAGKKCKSNILHTRTYSGTNVYKLFRFYNREGTTSCLHQTLPLLTCGSSIVEFVNGTHPKEYVPRRVEAGSINLCYSRVRAVTQDATRKP